MSKSFTIFTDGSSRGNPGPGGWGAIIVDTEKNLSELGGREENTTNNKMELMAALHGLEAVPQDVEVNIFTDSSYLINGITKWVFAWKKNGWKTKTKEDVLNKDLWERLDRAVSSRKIHWRHVAGHAGIVANERCDQIATSFADGKEIKLYKGPLSKYFLPNILDISHDEEKLAYKKTSGSRSRSKAYSYVSMVNGVIEVHQTWAECEKRVKGAKGAKYKKALDPADEEEIIDQFGSE